MFKKNKDLGSLSGSSAVKGFSSKTLTDSAWGEIRQDILDGQLTPGSKLSLEALKKQYNYGTGSLREALWRLCAEGLVISQSHRGFEVSRVFREQLIDITRLRIMLEQTALQESIEAGGDKWEADIVAAFHRLSKYTQEDGEPWNRWHLEFHEALVSACTAPILQQMRRQMFDLSSRYRKLAKYASVRDDLSEHRDLMESCLARDVTRANNQIADHFNLTAQLVLEKFTKEAREEWNQTTNQ